MASIEKKVSIAAKIYNDKLIGNKYRFFINEKECYITFTKSQFAHLVGVTAKNNSQFFKNAYEGTLTKSHYYFTDKQSLNNSMAKLSVFSEFFTDDIKYIKVYNDEIIIFVSNGKRAVLKIRIKSMDKPNHYVAVSLIRKKKDLAKEYYLKKFDFIQ